MTPTDIRAHFDLQFQASRAHVDVPLLVRRERLLREELVQANARLDAASRRDQLTDLPNRHHFEDALAQAWAQGQLQ